MSGEHENTVVLVETKSAFEADTVAQALRDRGVNAQVVDASTNAVWGGAVGTAKVVVMAHEFVAARAALDALRNEGVGVDWDATDVGSASGGAAAEKLREASKARRWAWTLVAIMVPISLFILAYGVQGHDPWMQAIGGVVLFSAIVMGLYMATAERREMAERD